MKRLTHSQRELPKMNRREFLQLGVFTAAVGTSVSMLKSEDKNAVQEVELANRVESVQKRVCLFTDLLDDFGRSYQDIASMLRQLKVAGPDLTVRPGGVVPPDRVTEELPRAAAAFHDHGLSIPMLSTGLLSANDPLARPTLSAMSQLGIRYYKLGYYRYGDLTQWEADHEAAKKELSGIIKLGEECGVEAGFHNHAGPTVGGAMWDLSDLFQSLSPKWVGSYFDPAHATIEGGEHGWKLGFQRLASRLKMIAIKDFIWEKVGGSYRARWVPLGEGMVRWSEFFTLLARVSFEGPISLHVEYDPGGKTTNARLENSLIAAERDLKFLRQNINEAYSTPK